MRNKHDNMLKAVVSIYHRNFAGTMEGKEESVSKPKTRTPTLHNPDKPFYALLLRQPKGCLAQMMRVFVCTPRDTPGVPSLRVLINPLVQPAPSSPHSSSSGCPQFHPGLESPLELPADSVWVIRLPYPSSYAIICILVIIIFCRSAEICNF